MIARRLLKHFPEHRIYLEPFGGGASLLLNKLPAPIEIYNDLDERITRLFRVLPNQGDAFQKHVQLVPYSRVEFNTAARYPLHATDVEKAVCDFIRWRQSFSGHGSSWSYSRTVSHGGMAGQVNAWWTAIEGLPEVIDRLRRVQITCEPAVASIQRFDHNKAFIYCDPPYVSTTRVARDVYLHEMTDRNHRELAQVLHKCNAKVMLSGYPSELYDELYGKWRQVEFRVANHASRAKKKPRVRECLWMNC